VLDLTSPNALAPRKRLSYNHYGVHGNATIAIGSESWADTINLWGGGVGRMPNFSNVVDYGMNIQGRLRPPIYDPVQRVSPSSAQCVRVTACALRLQGKLAPEGDASS